MRKVVAWGAAVGAVAWAALFLSNHGVLVAATELPAQTAFEVFIRGGDDAKATPAMLECHYFIATGFVSTRHKRLFVEACPRLHRIVGSAATQAVFR